MAIENKDGRPTFLVAAHKTKHRTAEEESALRSGLRDRIDAGGPLSRKDRRTIGARLRRAPQGPG